MKGKKKLLAVFLRTQKPTIAQRKPKLMMELLEQLKQMRSSLIAKVERGSDVVVNLQRLLDVNKKIKQLEGGE